MWKPITVIEKSLPVTAEWRHTWGDYKVIPGGIHCLSSGSLSFCPGLPGYSSMRATCKLTVPEEQGATIQFTDYLFSIGIPANPAAVLRLRTWPFAATGRTNWHSGKKQTLKIERKGGRITVGIDGSEIINAADPLTDDKIADFHLIVSEGTVIHKLILESEENFIPVLPKPKKNFHLYSCFDFGDDLQKGPWSPKTFNSAMQIYAGMGVKRIYFIYHYKVQSGWWDRPGKENEVLRNNIAATYKECGEFLDAAVSSAHKAGIELHAIYKPFESAIFPHFFPEGSEDALKHGKLPRLGGHLYQAPGFVAKNPGLRIERNMHDVSDDIDKRNISSISIQAEKGAGKTFQPERIQLWISKNNGRYTLYDKPLKLRTGRESNNNGREIIIDGLNMDVKYIALTVKDKPSYGFGNILRRMVKVYDTEGALLPVTFASPPKNADFRKKGMLTDVPEHSSGNGGGLDNYFWLDGSLPLGIMKGRERYLQGALCPDYPETISFWQEQVEDMLSAGVDGIDFRIANHNLSFEWESFGFNRTTVEAYQNRYGVNILTEPFDREKWRRLRGETYTEFLRWASKRLRKDGKTIQHHVSKRMRSPKWHTELEIYFDWQKWLDEGLLDELTIKMGELHSNQASVVKAAKNAGIKINYSPYLNGISQHSNGKQIIDMIIESSLESEIDGFTLYENAEFMSVTESGNAEVITPWLTEQFSAHARKT